VNYKGLFYPVDSKFIGDLIPLVQASLGVVCMIIGMFGLKGQGTDHHYRHMLSIKIFYVWNLVSVPLLLVFYSPVFQNLEKVCQGYTNFTSTYPFINAAGSYESISLLRSDDFFPQCNRLTVDEVRA
jgi:hypothetical protein